MSFSVMENQILLWMSVVLVGILLVVLGVIQKTTLLTKIGGLVLLFSLVIAYWVYEVDSKNKADVNFLDDKTEEAKEYLRD